jgi:hypothetical protein
LPIVDLQQKEGDPVIDLKRWLVSGASIAVLLFFVGVAVGQRIQSSRFDPYLTSTPKTMELAVLAANVGVMKDLLNDQVFSTGIEVPTITYDTKTKKLRARAVVNRNLVQQPVQKMKDLLTSSWAKTIVSVEAGFGEISHDEFEMSFVERRIDGAKITWVEFADFKRDQLTLK